LSLQFLFIIITKNLHNLLHFYNYYFFHLTYEITGGFITVNYYAKEPLNKPSKTYN
jgi:hypothetical protein